MSKSRSMATVSATGPLPRRCSTALSDRSQSLIDINEYADGLPHVPDKTPGRVWLVLLIYFFERFAFWGLSTPWQNYMANDAHNSPAPGNLDLGQGNATRIFAGFYTTYYMTSLISAILSDSRLGRYKTLLICSFIYAAGGLCICAASFPVKTGWSTTAPSEVLFFLGMGFIAFGAGGFKGIIIPFMADQYETTTPRLRTEKNGQKVVVMWSQTLGRICNYYYWVGNVGSLSWLAVVFLEKNRGFWVAFALPLGSFLVGLLIFILAEAWFIRGKPVNIFPQAAKITICAIRGNFNFDKACPEYLLEVRGKTVSWDKSLVSELRRGYRACIVFFGLIAFYGCFDQMQNNLISQAAQMETGGTPNDLLPAMNQIGCILFTPLLEFGLNPILRKRRISFEPIARITIGFGLVCASMVWATITQKLIYNTGPCYDHPNKCDAAGAGGMPNHLSVWIQTPIYFLIAAGEILAVTAALEYAESNAPKELKATVQAVQLLMAGIGSLLALALTPLAKDPLVIILYCILAVLMFAVTCVYLWLWQVRRYRAAEVTIDSQEVWLDDMHDSDNDSKLLKEATERRLSLGKYPESWTTLPSDAHTSPAIRQNPAFEERFTNPGCKSVKRRPDELFKLGISTMRPNDPSQRCVDYTTARSSSTGAKSEHAANNSTQHSLARNFSLPELSDQGPEADPFADAHSVSMNGEKAHHRVPARLPCPKSYGRDTDEVSPTRQQDKCGRRRTFLDPREAPPTPPFHSMKPRLTPLGPAPARYADGGFTIDAGGTDRSTDVTGAHDLVDTLAFEGDSETDVGSVATVLTAHKIRTESKASLITIPLVKDASS